MTSREAIAKYGDKPGYIFKLKQGNTPYLVVGDGKILGLDGYMTLKGCYGKYAVTEVWKIGATPGMGLSQILGLIRIACSNLEYDQANLVAVVSDISNAFLNTKIFVGTKSKEIQEKLFGLGYRWCSPECKVQNEDEPFLYIDCKGYLTCSSTYNGYEYFKEKPYREVSIDEILEYSE